MGLLGSYSNPEVQRRVRRLAEEVDRLSMRNDALRPSKRADRKLRSGLVPRAIRRVLADSTRPMPVQEIHAVIEDQLGLTVPVSSVNAWLSQNATGDRPSVARLGRGRYCLIETE
jgi:hypothetical protein